MKNVMFPRECFKSTKDFISTNFIYGRHNPNVSISSCEATFDDKGYATSLKLPANFKTLTATWEERNTYLQYFLRNSKYIFDLDFKRVGCNTNQMCWGSTSVRSYVNIKPASNTYLDTIFAGSNVNGNNMTLIHIIKIEGCSMNYAFVGTKVDKIIVDNCVNVKYTGGTVPFTGCNVAHLILNNFSNVSINLSSSRLDRQSMIELFNSLGTCTATATITLGATLLAKLTDEDKKIATDKGWTLA